MSLPAGISRVGFLHLCADLPVLTPQLTYFLWNASSVLYLTEGLISIVFAPIAYYAVPNSLTTAWFLNKEEKDLAAIRYEINREHFDPDEKFSWYEVRRGCRDWKTWAHAVNQFCVDVSLYGVTTFMPTIIKGLDITKDTVYSQLLTVPVYLVAAVSFIIGAQLSDRYRTRSIPLFVYGGIMVTGYVIIAVVESPAVRYFGVFVTGLGVYAMRLWISVALTLLSMVITTFHALALKRINRHRAALVAAGAPDQPELGDDNPHFVFYL
ncbi:hypothetical protein P7C70_g2033, partial [Phenoliferia sp. Uapishka_3]